MTPKELRDLRTHAGLTQEELASLLGKDRMTVSRWETGKIKINRALGWMIRMVIREYLAARHR